MKGKSIFLNIVFAFCLSYSIFAFDDVDTHPRITNKAIESTNLDNYLIQNLGLKDGLKTKLPSDGKDSIVDWLKKGSTDEDSPLCRASNHFHNPLKSWGQSGVSDQPSLISGWCSLTGYSTKYSNVTWATGYLAPAPNGSKITISGQEMGWDNAREYYHLALTSQSSTDRETNFAMTFQSLGQVIHLIEDMAVPAHTRNDFTAHVYFQEVAFRNPTTWFGNSFEWYVKQNPSLVTSSETVQIDFTNAGITRFWDTDVYDGSSRLTDTSIGLAEYTNANFFSDYTIFAESKDSQDVHYFPLPTESDTNAYLIEQQAEDGNKDKVYYVKLNSEDYKLAAYSYFHLWRNILPYWGWAYCLDDEVHKDYALELISRAIGYSAGLLNYFFRGELEVVQNSNSNSITITNNSSEDMDGTFTLYYDASDDTRKSVSDGSWSIVLEAGSTSNELNFTEPEDLGEDKRYILVFEGTLGSESNAVVGKNMSLSTKLFAGGSTLGRIFDFDGTTWVLNVTLSAATQIYSLGIFQNKLYAGTWSNGQVFVTDDGVLWSLSTGSVGGEGFCFTLEEFNGALYSGVGISHTSFHINKFDGVSWISHTALTNTRGVRALKVYNGKLYAATEGSYPVGVKGQVYVYDGIAWSLSKDFAPNNPVQCLEVFNNKLYAGTDDSAQLGVFDGATWSTSTPFGAATSVYTLKVYNGKLYAGTDNNRIFVSDDGITWLESNIFTETQVRSLEIYSGKLYAGVNSGGKVYVFDGSMWALSGTLSTKSILSLKAR